MPPALISTVWISLGLRGRLSAVPPLGNLRFMLCVSMGVVITKMISSTNAKSSSGVMLMSLRVTNELR